MVTHKHNPKRMFYTIVIEALPYLFLGDENDFREDLVKDLRDTFHRLQNYPEDDADLLSKLKKVGVELNSDPSKKFGYIQQGEIKKFRSFFKVQNGIAAPFSKDTLDHIKVLDIIKRNPGGIELRDIVCEVLCIEYDTYLKESKRIRGGQSETGKKMKTIQWVITHLKQQQKIKNVRRGCYILV